MASLVIIDSVKILHRKEWQEVRYWDNAEAQICLLGSWKLAVVLYNEFCVLESYLRWDRVGKD